ncbi:DUF6153 family protein [Pseudonocardia spinosispora]|uniref:DUF6153 family protein n=1 Tax=Pseudonocardia spinosispora TaxID=103441 RepID=UPI00040150CA|nr:DUF6153 family protein [Pseudonocardia spinosispora]
MAARQTLVVRWLLILVIGAGVVAMHSVMGPSLMDHRGAPHPPSHSMAHHAPDQSGDMPGHSGHDGASMLGHLCLAVLGVFGLALLILPMLLAVLRRRQVRPAQEALGSVVSVRPRAPPAPTSLRLAELCISRR